MKRTLEHLNENLSDIDSDLIENDDTDSEDDSSSEAYVYTDSDESDYYDKTTIQTKLINQEIEKLESLNSNHSMYITEYFDKIINEIDITSENLLLKETLPEETIRIEQAKLVDRIIPIQQICLKNYFMNNRDNKFTLQFTTIIERLKEKLNDTNERSKSCYLILDDMDVEDILFNLMKEAKSEYIKAQHKLLSGYSCKIVGYGVDIRCSYDYKTIDKSLMLSEHESEVLYRFEQMNNFNFGDAKNEMLDIYRASKTPEELIEYLQLIAKIDIPKKFFPIEQIHFKIPVSRCRRIHNYKLFFGLGLGLISGYYDTSKASVRNNLFKKLKASFIGVMTPRMIKYIYAIIKHVGISLSKKQWKILDKIHEMESCDHDTISDDMWSDESYSSDNGSDFFGGPYDDSDYHIYTDSDLD